MATCRVTIDLEIGPTMRAALDVMECASEVLELIPDWNKAEREELKSRIIALAETAERSLVQRPQKYS